MRAEPANYNAPAGEARGVGKAALVGDLEPRKDTKHRGLRVVRDSPADEWTVEVEGGAAPLVPPGQYSLALKEWATFLFAARRPKVVLWFRIVDMGPHFETVLPRYYNAAKLIGPPARSGRFKAPRHGDFIREFSRLACSPQRMDRFDLRNLKTKIVTGEVRTVTESSRQEQLAEPATYSVISNLIRVEHG